MSLSTARELFDIFECLIVGALMVVLDITGLWPFEAAGPYIIGWLICSAWRQGIDGPATPGAL